MKCHKYWPEEDTVTQYGPVHVAAKEKIELADFTIRSFDLKNVSVYFWSLICSRIGEIDIAVKER